MIVSAFILSIINVHYSAEYFWLVEFLSVVGACSLKPCTLSGINF